MPDLGKRYSSIIEMKIQEIEIFRHFISSRKESENVKAVDDLIENLALHISEVISSGKEREHEIAEKTKALAELVSARATTY